ncbi:AAA family ATPase [Catenulispora sp. MAP5-51]|uniref:helix-turn-helix transcriptional regulator n=1 Tax=Catenulispora sp. MAP5-51 TaxID=3156298 RepID=UPI0035127B86
MQARPLRGRSAEMTTALSVVRSTSRHGSSAAILLSGPAGIGKTALLSAVCHEAVSTGMTVLRGKCDPIEQVWPGAPVLALLRSGRDEVCTRQEYERITRLVDEPLVLAEAVAACLDAAARRRPVLIALDDVQWADRVSAFILRNLVPRLVGLPVVWAFAGRSDQDAAEWFGSEPVHVERIRLAPLATADVLALAADRLGHAPDARTGDFLAAVEGNPFHAGQIIEEIARSAGRGELDAVPVAFAASVSALLGSLPQSSRELVEVVAAAGRPFALSEAAAPVGGNPGANLGPAVDAGLVVLRADSTVAFHHDLVREQVYSTIRAERLRELHRRLADHYLAAGDPLIAASHARAAAVPGDLDSATIMIAAAESLAAVSGEDAGDLVMAVLDIVRPDQPGWLDLSLRCLSVLCRVQWAAEAVVAADQILAHVDDSTLIGRVESDAARALWLGGRVGELLTRIERALRLDTVEPGVGVRLRAVHSLAGARLLDGQTAVGRALTVLDEARMSGDEQALALALEAAGHSARNDGRHQQALRYFRELARLNGRSLVAEEVIELQFLDRYEHAQTLLNQATAEAVRNHGERLPAVLAAQAWQDFNLGRLDDAEAGCQTLLEIGPRLGDAVYALDAVIVRVSSALLRGDVDSAATYLRVADEIEGADAVLREPGLTVMNGWIAAGRGDHETAREVLRPVIADVAERSACSYWPMWPCWMGLFFEIGDLAQDKEFMAAATKVTEQAAERNPGVASFEGVALLTRGRTEGDVRMIERGADVLTHSPRPLLRGFGAFSHGRALVEAGDRQTGLAQLDRAWDEYHGMGAWFYRALTQDMMRQAGARLGKWSAAALPPAAGWASLTQAERRVAMLIGAGSTNKAAASELGVSVNTIGTHLRSVFAKLGVRSRVQLANSLHEESL